MCSKCSASKLKIKYLIFKFTILLFITSVFCEEEFCHADSSCSESSNSKKEKFILYDVNPPEGFNLRRDVYMRFAILAHKLKKSKNELLKNFKLVLPPWSHLYHWKYNPEPEHIPWSLFFDLKSLKDFAPVVEMHEFFHSLNKTYVVEIDQVYILQHFKDMFETGNFEDRMKIDECSQKSQLNYFFYKNVTSKNVKCLSYHGPATKLSELLVEKPSKTVLFHHAEVALHDMFGDKLYWQCRRSMRFNLELKQIANEFRKNNFNSSDEFDATVLPDLWKDEKPGRNAKGGPYLGVHLRRQDFLRGRSHQAPSLVKVAEQIVELLEEINLQQVFIATDASSDEYEEIVQNIPSKYTVVRYTPSQEIKTRYKDGGIAIIDQIICSHARYFIGTYKSTFSFRIQEEREILGFPSETTFNSFCGDSGECSQPSVWKIVY